MSLTAEDVKATEVPKVFGDTSLIGSYGSTEAGSKAMTAYSDLMEGSPVTRLAEKIGEIVAKLADADPRRVAKKPTWVERFTGQNVETHVRYQVARKQLDELLLDAESIAQRVRDTLTALDALLTSYRDEVQHLTAHIQAGRDYLNENPDAGKPAPGSLEFDNPRERFARKLANLATLQASHEMSVTQMKLTRAQAVDMLDRFHETVAVLVPVWRQHTLALLTSKSMNPSMVAEATKAHQALMRSLAQSMDGLEK